MMWSGKFSRGFTLLELIMVVALMGTIAAFVTVRVGSSIEATRFEAAVRDCATLFRMAKTHAIYHRCRVRVVYLPDSRKLRIVSLVPNQQGEIDEVQLRVYKVPDAVSSFEFVGSGRPGTDLQIAFTSLGTSQGGQIILKSTGIAARKITVAPVTGVVKIGQADA